MDGINGRRGVEMEEGIGRKSREQEKDLPPLYGGGRQEVHPVQQFSDS